MGDVYFGTRSHMVWVPAPSVNNLDFSRVGWQSTMQFKNGGAGVSRSKNGHKEYVLTWQNKSRDSLRPITDFASGVYDTSDDTELIYFLDPMAADKNALPILWSAPALAHADGLTLFPGQTPTVVPTPPNAFGYPARSAQYVTNTASSSTWVPIPPGYCAWVGAHGSATGNAGVLAVPTVGGNARPASNAIVRTNLLTNPSFEAAGTAVTIATNLLTNPSMEAAGSASGVRSNLCTNPRMLTLTGWTNGTSSSVTQTATASGQQYDVTASVGNLNIVTYQTAAIAVSPGDLVTTSMQVTVPAGYPAMTVVLDAQEYASGGSTITARGASVTIQPGQTVTVTSGTLTVDASGNGFRSILRFAATTPVGARIIVANCLVEKTASIGFYFDGSSVLDSGLVGAWTSTPDASASVLMATAVTSWTPQNGYCYQSSAQVHSRSKSTACVLNAVVSAGCYTTFTQVIGTVYTLSAWVYSPTAVTMRAAYTNGTVSSGGTATTVPANTWTRLWVTGTAASSTTGFLSILTTVAPPAGTLIYIDDADAVASPVLTDHFDGASAAADDFTYAWTGTADASTSVQQGVAPTETTSGTFAACIASSQWATAGATSLRIIPISTSTNTFSGIGGYQGGFKYGMVAGGTYTMLATARLAGPQGGSLLALARSIAVWVNGTSGWTNIATSAAAPNAAGATDLRVAFTIPAGATGVWIGLYNGASAGNGDVWWDNLALVEGTYTGPAFNGDTPIANGLISEWTGAENASTSVQRATNLVDLLPVTDARRVTTMIDSTDADGVLISYTNGGPTSTDTLTLSGLMVQVLPRGVIPQAGGFISGQGHSGLEFAQHPQELPYSSVLDQMGMSVKMIETGSWL